MPQKVPLCSVIDCPNSDRHRVRSAVFYFVPNDPLRSAKWKDALKGYIYGGRPKLNSRLICMNHFETNAFEADSKKLKIDAVPSIFPSLSRQTRGDLKNATPQAENVEHSSKRIKLTNVFSPITSKQLDDKDRTNQISRKYVSQGKSSNVPHAFMPSEIKNISILSRSTEHSVLISKNTPSKETNISSTNNAQQSLLEVQNRSVFPNKSEVKQEHIELKYLKCEQEKVEGDDNFSLKEFKRDEESDIKPEIIDIKPGSSSDDESTEVFDASKGNNSTEYEKLIKLKMRKQKLMEKHEKLTKRRQEVALELQKLQGEIKRKKEEQRNLPGLEIEILKKCFSATQIRLLTGRIKSKWSLDDLAMAYTISVMGSREVYTYLQTNLNYPLPAFSNITRWFKSKKSNVSENTDKISVQNVPATQPDEEV